MMANETDYRHGTPPCQNPSPRNHRSNAHLERFECSTKRVPKPEGFGRVEICCQLEIRDGRPNYFCILAVLTTRSLCKQSQKVPSSRASDTPAQFFKPARQLRTTVNGVRELSSAGMGTRKRFPSGLRSHAPEPSGSLNRSRGEPG